MKRNLIVLMISAMCLFTMSACSSSGEAESSTQAADTRLSVTDTLTAEHFEFSILSVTASQSVKTEIGTEYTAAEGNTMVTVVFAAKNISDDTQNVMYTNFNSYVDGNKVSMVGAVGKVDGYMPLIGAVSSGMSFDGYTIWELPKDWGELEFTYIDALTGSESENSFVIYHSDISE